MLLESSYCVENAFKDGRREPKEGCYRMEMQGPEQRFTLCVGKTLQRKEENGGCGP